MEVCRGFVVFWGFRGRLGLCGKRADALLGKEMSLFCTQAAAFVGRLGGALPFQLYSCMLYNSLLDSIHPALPGKTPRRL